MFFALGAEDAVDGVRRSPGGLVIVPDLHFTQQANSQHVQSRKEQNRSEDHEGTVLHQQMRIMEQLLEAQPSSD